jgi:hypothetical protein
MDLFKRLENQRIVEEKPASAPAPQPPAEVK